MSTADGIYSSPETIGTQEVARIASVSTQTVRAWLARGELPEPIEHPGRGYRWWCSEMYECLGKRGLGPWAHKYAPGSNEGGAA